MRLLLSERPRQKRPHDHGGVLLLTIDREIHAPHVGGRQSTGKAADRGGGRRKLQHHRRASNGRGVIDREIPAVIVEHGQPEGCD